MSTKVRWVFHTRQYKCIEIDINYSNKYTTS